jgi:hypothetical protein
MNTWQVPIFAYCVKTSTHSLHLGQPANYTPFLEEIFRPNASGRIFKRNFLVAIFKQKIFYKKIRLKIPAKKHHKIPHPKIIFLALKKSPKIPIQKNPPFKKHS